MDDSVRKAKKEHAVIEKEIQVGVDWQINRFYKNHASDMLCTHRWSKHINFVFVCVFVTAIHIHVNHGVL